MIDFILEQVLQMRWLHQMISDLLLFFQIRMESSVGKILHFFLYDTIKIILLLCCLIFIVSYIQSYFPPERSKKLMSKAYGCFAYIIAALLGTITPFCSCSSIPMFIAFTSARIPLGISFSFLISSPMVDLSSFILLMSFFGSKVAFLYVLLGLGIAVIGGMVIEKLAKKGDVEEFVYDMALVTMEEAKQTQIDRIKSAMEHVKETFKHVIPYILIGVGVGAWIHNVIPETWVSSILGQNQMFGVLFATLIGIPIYADIFQTLPIAEALLSKGAGLGSVLAFMMGVTTLSLPSMILLKKVMKPRLLGIFIGICCIGILLVGYVFYMMQFML